jgi:hypothetical protein
VTRVYRDGVVVNTVTHPGNLNTHGVDTLNNPLPMRVGSQTQANGVPEPAWRPSMTIAKIRVYAVALADSKILENYNLEKGQFIPANPEILNESYDIAAGRFAFSWTPAAGRTYAVEAANVLGDPNAWAPVATGVTSGSFSETVPAGDTARFYRLRIE